MADIKAFIHQFPESHVYYPQASEIRKLPKWWVISIASSVIGEPFDNWIREQINARNEKVSVEKGKPFEPYKFDIL